MNLKSAEFIDAVDCIIDNNKTVKGLVSDVAVLKSDVAVLKSDVAVLKSDVAVLKSDVKELKVDTGSLRDTVHKIGIAQEHMRSDIKLILEMVVHMNQKLDGHSDHPTQLKDHEQRINALEYSFTKHIKDQATHKLK